MQVGDRVKCITPRDNLVKNSHYIVTYVRVNKFGTRLCRVEGIGNIYWQDRFVVENEIGQVEPVIEAPVRAFKFLKGDKVRCLNNAAGQFTRGKIYTVSHDGDTVSVDEDDGGIRNGWAGEFFQLVEEVNRHITLYKYIIIFFNRRTQKVSSETRDTEHQAQEFIDKLGRDGHPVLKKTKLKFDVEVPEGVVL